ncbi:MAG: hypothetical protein GXP13_05965 [Gammaproteobacteria bacterium]|nr:hypothetical protein [Gammaproteobacteria bacterium]
MYTHFINSFWKAALVLISITAINASAFAAATTNTFQVVGNTAIYLGVIPAQMIQGHPKMHGGVPMTWGGSSHIIISLFNNDTGKRIEDAKITANVMRHGVSDQEKNLEAMKTSGVTTYGNYFDMPGNDTYHIKLWIHRPGVKGSLDAEFTHRHFSQ